MNQSMRVVPARIVLAGLLSVGACEQPQQHFFRNGRPPDLPSREIRSVEWDTKLIAGGEADDSTLLVPMPPVVNAAGLFFGDLAGRRIVHLDHAGNVVWTYGQSGQGPGEFQSPREVRLDATGRVWVLDARNARITVLSPDGQEAQFIPVQSSGMPFRILPLSGDTAILVTNDASAPFAVIDEKGAEISRHPFPWSGYADLHSLTSQFLAAFDPKDHEWVAAFTLGDGFFPLRGVVSKGWSGWYVEPVPFPVPIVRQEGDSRITEFAERPLSSAISVTLSPDHLFVLYGGRTEHRGQVVDRYRRSDGGYVSSFLLPHKASGLAWYDGGFYLLSSSPFPQLAFARPSALE
jgi:hypothetical protein